MHPALARVYAGRTGGEAYHEVVGAALRMLDPDLGAGAADVEAARLLAEQPALVTLDVPFERVVNESLPGRRRTPWTFDERAEHDARLRDEFPANNVRVHQPVVPGWVVFVELVEPVVAGFALDRYIPVEHARRLMMSSGRPTSIGPRDKGVHTVSAVRSWLAEHDLEPVL